MVRFKAGPTWARSGDVREQPGWDAHAGFVDGLVERGTMVMGGPFADDAGTMILLEQVDAAEAERLVVDDPFILNGVFVLEEVREWTLFVDELSAKDQQLGYARLRVLTPTISSPRKAGTPSASGTIPPASSDRRSATATLIAGPIAGGRCAPLSGTSVT
jgi:uncharacterized protein YciI